MLQVDRVTKNFGGLAAVNTVDMAVQRGELVGLIGPNGAGKTTFFNLVTGYLKPSSGIVTFEGKDVTGKRPHTVAARGMIRSFQQDNVFADFTVLQNVRLACHLNSGINFWQTVFRTRSSRRNENRIEAKAEEILEVVGIRHLAELTAGSLPHGHKRMLGIAVALACEPKLLLLDEPLAGMNTAEVDETIALVRRLWEGGLTVLLIEHNMRAAMSLCQRFVVLSFGKKIAEGTPDEIRNDPDVIKAYLGTSGHAA